MTLSELFDMYIHDTPIKLGAEEGSGFFYCGTIRDLMNKLEDYNDILYNHEEHLINRCYERICQMQNGYIPDGVSKEMWQNELERRQRRLEWLQDAHLHYIHLGDREVIQDYNATGFDEGSIIVIIEGYENGAYWTLDEVRIPMSFARGGAEK